MNLQIRPGLGRGWETLLHPRLRLRLRLRGRLRLGAELIRHARGHDEMSGRFTLNLRLRLGARRDLRSRQIRLARDLPTELRLHRRPGLSSRLVQTAGRFPLDLWLRPLGARRVLTRHLNLRLHPHLRLKCRRIRAAGHLAVQLRQGLR